MRRQLFLRSCTMLALLSCEPHLGHIEVEAGSTAPNVTFLISNKRGESAPVASMFGLVVTRYQCGSSRSENRGDVWVIQLAGDSQALGARAARSVPSRIAYGTTPAGYASVLEPRALEPGCYQASLLGANVRAETYFRVDSTGRVTEEDQTDA